MRQWGARALTATVTTAVLAGCSSGPSLPNRGDSAVQAEERRIAALLAEATWVENPHCEARLLRQEDAVSWAWARCDGDVDGTDQGESLPVRVDGNQVRRPADGTYVEDVRDLFPADLADGVLASQESFQP